LPLPTAEVRAPANLIWSAFEQSRPDGAYLQCLHRGGLRRSSWDDWRRDAVSAALRLHELGVPVGGCVGAVLTNSYETCVAAIGCWLAGITLASLPTMRRGQSPADYQRQLKRLCAHCGAELLLVDEESIELARTAGVQPPVATFASLRAERSGDLTPLDPGAPAFIQYTSGSTGDPKGIVLTLDAISEQMRMLIDGFRVEPGSQAVTWLPLSHDMGFFGFVILSWTAGMQLLVSTPERFIRKPATWLDDAAAVGADLTMAPPFGLALATRAAERTPPRHRCRLTSLAIGAEPIELSTLQRAAEVLGPFGVGWECLAPAYGLAEATLGVSMKRWGEQPRHIDPSSESGRLSDLQVDPEIVRSGRPIVSCGPAFDGVRIGTDSGRFGQIWISSPSLLDGYLGSSPDPVAQGRFQTRDLGFVDDGELYVLGRVDDMIPYGGRNIFARDVERGIEQVRGLRPGCCVLVAIEPSDDYALPRLAVVAELAGQETGLAPIARDVSSAAHAAAGVPVEECVFLKRGSLPKTPSGKLQRHRCREIALSNDPRIAARISA
jgi:fatty-acyl-CoA synthase